MEDYVDDMLVKNKSVAQHIADPEETFSTLRRHGMRLNPTKCAFRVVSKKFLSYIVSHKRIEVNLEKIQIILDLSPPQTINVRTQSLTLTFNQLMIIN